MANFWSICEHREEATVPIAEPRQPRADDEPALSFCYGAVMVQREEERQRLEGGHLARKTVLIRLADGFVERGLCVAEPVRAGELERPLELAERHGMRLTLSSPFSPRANETNLARRVSSIDDRSSGRRRTRYGLRPEFVCAAGRAKVKVDSSDSPHRRRRRIVLDRDAGHVHAVNRRRMHLHDRHRPVRDETDAVAGHPVAAGTVALQVIDMPRRTDELEPLGDAEQHGPAVAGEKGIRGG